MPFSTILPYCIKLLQNGYFCHFSKSCNFFRYLAIIPRARVGYEMIVANEARSAELALIISYPPSASGIIVLLKTPPKY